MKTGLLTLPLAALAAIWCAALADAGIQALGGGSVQHVLVIGFLLSSIGLGMLAPRACGGGTVVAILWGTLAGLVLPSLAGVLAPLTAGAARSPATAQGLAALVVLLGFPTWRLGRHLGARFTVLGGSALDLVLLGLFGGLGLLLWAGLGPMGFLAVGLLLLLFNFVPWPEDYEERLHQPRAARPLEALPMLLIGAAGAAALLFLLPFLELYDSSSAVQDARRWWTFGAGLVFASMTLGGAFAETRLGAPVAAAACAALAFGLHEAAEGIAAWEDRRAFSWRLHGAVLNAHAALHPAWLPEFLRGPVDWLSAPLAIEERLDERDWQYVPWLVGGLSWIVVVSLGTAARAAGGSRPRRDGPVAPGGLLGLLLLGAGLGWWALGLLLHPEWSDARGQVAGVLALAAAAACAASWHFAGPGRAGPGARRSWSLRGALAVAAVGAGWWFGPPPVTPESNAPYFSNWDYQVVERADGRAEAHGPITIARAIDRQAAPRLGSYFVAEGRNFLTPDRSGREEMRQEAAFAAVLAGDWRRSLLVGSPRAEHVRTLRDLRAVRVDAACDPPALWALGAEALPGWKRRLPDQVVATPAESEGAYDLVLVSETAVWSTKRNPFRTERLATCASRLAQGGTLAVGIDPRRMHVEVLGSVAAALLDRFDDVKLWLQPRGWHPPRLMFTARRVRDEERIEGAALEEDAGLRQMLQDGGMPLHETADLDLLLLAADEALEGLPRVSARAPFPQTAVALADTEYREVDEIRPQERAAGLLADVSEALEVDEVSLLGFYARHMDAQVYSVSDDQYVEEYRKIDLGEDALEILARLTETSDNDGYLRNLWAQFAELLAEKREPLWIEEYVRPLHEERGWRNPEILFALGRSAWEMLDDEAAVDFARQAIQAREGYLDAHWLHKDALLRLERNDEALAAMQQYMIHEPDPGPAHYNALGIAALRAGQAELAGEVARHVLETFGRGSLAPELAESLELGDVGEDGPDLVHPEYRDDGRKPTQDG